MGTWIMSLLAHELRTQGFETRSVSYDSVSAPPDEHVDRLATQLADADARPLHFVAHSMGGLITLRYLVSERRPRRAGRTVLLGTPARGSQAALEFGRQPWGPLMLGRSAELWHSALPEAVPRGLEVGAIAGNEPFGLGALLVDLPGPSDGVVTVEETRLEGLRDHIVLPVSHTGMLMSKPVAEQTGAFLRTGAFNR
jgi:pimeloyl-ACP methyl ester carboxylesterase